MVRCRGCCCCCGLDDVEYVLMLEMIECAVVYALLLAGCWLAADSLVVCDGSEDNDDANDGDSGRGNYGAGPE